MTQLIDKKQAAKMLGVSITTLDRMRAVGLRAVKFGGDKSHVRFEQEEIERFVKKNRE